MKQRQVFIFIFYSEILSVILFLLHLSLSWLTVASKSQRQGEMAESAVSLVIEYLAPLLVQEARLLKGIHNKVASIKGELEIIQSFLKDADARAEIEHISN